MAMVDDDLRVGSRTSHDGRPCTVRYIGTLASSSHEYLGVEWDDPSHGKHNGEHEGVRYFTCLSKAEHPASFVRRKRPRDKRRTFVEALKEKYASQEVTSDQSDVVRISGKDVEEVGFDKIKLQQANLKSLRVVVLDGMCIGSKMTGTGSEAVAAGVAEYCPSCARLDLSRNLFESWDEILAIIEQLPALSELHIDGNRLHLRNETSSESREQVFRNVKVVGLDDCLLGWQEIQAVTSCFPNLLELSICRNQLADLSTGQLPLSVRQIQLDGNELSSMSQLDCLTALPGVKHIGLRNNRISRTTSFAQSRPPLTFSKTVSDVDVSSNLISEWSFVNQLSHMFPGLTALRLSSNPLYEDLADAEGAKLVTNDAFMLTIARLADLQALNHSKIDAKARQNAELYYLSQIGKELAAALDSEQSTVIERHPRYEELCAKYGEPTVARKSLSTIDPNSLAARFVRCRVTLGDSVTTKPTEPQFSEQRSVEVDIPRSFTVYNATSVIAERFPALKPMEVDILWETGEELVVKADPESESESETNGLSEIEDGDSKKQPMLRDELLVPRTRRIGTWLEGPAATLRLEKRLSSRKGS